VVEVSNLATASWLIVIGVALEVSGALLISGSLLLPIILRRWDQLAVRSRGFVREHDPELEDMHELAYAAVGGVLLVSGFATQLSGYVLEFSTTGLYVAAFGIAIGSIVAGHLFVRMVVARYLLTRARRATPQQARR
jgi:hypothetical protein